MCDGGYKWKKKKKRVRNLKKLIKGPNNVSSIVWACLHRGWIPVAYFIIRNKKTSVSIKKTRRKYKKTHHGCTLCSVFHACLHLPDVRFNPHCLSFSSSLSKLSSFRHCCVVVVAVEDIAMSSCNTNCDKYNLSDKKSEHYSPSNSFATCER